MKRTYINAGIGAGTSAGGGMAGLSRRAMRAEMLDAATERDLALAWRECRDEAALHRLVTAYMRLAVSMAGRFARYGAAQSDLVQQAGLGLLKAAERFDPDRGVRFSTYAIWWIKAEMQDFVLRNFSIVRLGSTTAQKSLFFNLRRVQAQIQREARARGEELDGPRLQARIARRIGVPLADVEMMDGRMAGGDLSLNARQSGDEDGREWIETIEDESQQAEARAAARIDRAVLRGWLGEALAALSPRERHIVAARKLAETARTLEDLGAELGLSKERVRQVEAAAFAKMRAQLAGRSPEVRALLA